MKSKTYYDAALTFAGEQRFLARGIARQLSPLGYSIFYDEYVDTFGRDLAELFHTIYSSTKFIIMLVSKEYMEKAWTKFERRAAIENSLDHPDHRILQVRIDDLVVPGISKVIGYYNWDGDFNKLCATLIGQFGPRPLPALSGSGIEAKEVLRICSRRAIFTNMKDEISTKKMFASIEACIAGLQKLNLDITDKSLTQYVKSIIRDLDNLDRYSRDAPSYTVFFPDFIKDEMNSIKLSIIDKLHFLNVQFNVGVDLPNDIGFSYAVRELHPGMVE